MTSRPSGLSEVMYEEPHVLYSLMNEEVSMDAESTRKLFGIFDECSAEKPYGVITDSTRTSFPSIERDAFAAARDVENHPRFKAHAFVAKQTGMRLLIHFFLRNFPMSIPGKMFDNADDAAMWIRNEVIKSSPDEIFQINAIITGKVQGVFYRNNCEQKANELHLKGFVKNLPHGSVQAVAQGNGSGIALFIDWCKKGPKNARVEKVSFVFEPVDHSLTSFSIAR